MALPIIIFSVITLELDWEGLRFVIVALPGLFSYLFPPIKSPILLKYKNPYKRNSMYPNISKRNAKSCTCCNHLICQSTIISSVNHRQFSVVNNSDLDWKSDDVIHVLTCSEGGWGMQYVGQTKRALKTRFKEHLLKIKKKKKKKNKENWYVSLSTFPEYWSFTII